MKKTRSILLILAVLGFILSAAYSATTVCRWKDNKKGAWSMEFDDSMFTHVSYVIPNFISRGLTGTFNVNPASTYYAWGIMTWESLCGRNGIDLENHTMNHYGATDMTMAAYEISETAKIIRTLRTPGQSPLVLFVEPGGSVWPPNYTTIIPGFDCLYGRGD
jgi:hypothetical protein